MNSNRYSALLIAALAVQAAACGDIASGGLDSGEVRAVAAGDGAAQTSMAAAPARAGDVTAAAAARGTISFSADVTLFTSAGEPIPLTTAPVAATVRIEGTDLATLAIRRVPVGTYSSVRVVLSAVSANVDSGLIVNGTPFLGPLTVALGPGGSTTVEAPVQMVVEPTFSTTLLVDLRASAWLPATDLLTRTVPGSTFRSAVRVTVQ